MVVKTLLGAAFAFSLSQTALAGVWYEVSPSQIDHMRAHSVLGQEMYVLQYKQTFPGDGCTERDFAYIRTNDTLAKEMYSTALAGFLAGKTLKIYTTGCDNFGNVIQAVGIKG